MPRTPKTPAKNAAKGKAKPSAAKPRKPPPPGVFDAGPDTPSVKSHDTERLTAMAAVAAKFKGARPTADVLRVVRAVPTIFPWFDFGTRVGGFPIERVTTVHGRSNEGKTLFASGLCLSFLRAGHFAHIIDAERTTPITWLEKLWGHDMVNHPGFSASRPDTYESCVATVRDWCNVIGNARAKGAMPKDTSGIIILDSLRKLVPKDLWDRINKEVKEDSAREQKGGGVDGYNGRAAQIRAALNAAWLDELTVLLEQTGTSLVFIARESEETEGTGMFAKKSIKVGGGRAIIYDSSLVVRIERASWVTEGTYEAKNLVTIGEKHKATIRKTKVAEKDDKEVITYFHSSNGVRTPAGYDRARDVFELAKLLGVVAHTKGSSWYVWGRRRWQGEATVIARLIGEPATLAELEADVRSKFRSYEPESVDEDGVVRDVGVA